MRDTVLDEEQQRELAELEREVEKSDFEPEAPEDEEGLQIEEEESEETAFSLWYSKASESRVRIRPDLHRTGWEAKIAVLQSITVDFLKTTLGAALLGLVHPVPDVTAPKPSGFASVISKLEKKKLNERQMDAMRQMLDPGNIAIRMEAPASTGKTRTMVMACGALTTLYPNARFIMTAETNKAGEKLIDEAASVLKPQNPLSMLYVVSMAQELRGDFAQDHPVFVYGIVPHLKALIKQTEDSIRQKAKKKDAKAKEVGPLSLLELKKAKIFVAIKQADSRAPLDDAPMIELVLAKSPGIQIVVTTCSKLQAHKAM
ncbi:hypothetical protein AAVH_21116 [Aphelenchoides avenae]|nr:hypothetical protein AAVH_21116 [Aphelenchus avenae]